MLIKWVMGLTYKWESYKKIRIFSQLTNNNYFRNNSSTICYTCVFKTQGWRIENVFKYSNPLSE